MIWPFSRRREIRQAPYTDAVVAAIVAARGAAATDPDPKTTGAATIAASLVARAFASAKVEGMEIPPSLLSDIGRDLTLHGEAVLTRAGGEVVRAAQWEISGRSPVQDGWTYRLQLPAPDGLQKTVTPGIGVAHPRFATDGNRPWVGIGPLDRQIESARLLARLESVLSNECSGPVGYLLPLPTDGQDDSIDSLREDLKGMAGGVAVVETTAGGWGEGRFGAPAADWRPQRIGPDPPASLIPLLQRATMTVLAGCGVPVQLVDTEESTGQREAWRRFLHATLEPLARIVAPQLGRLADGRPVSFDFSALEASDITGRARAFGSLVQGGMPIPQAVAAAGLLDTE